MITAWIYIRDSVAFLVSSFGYFVSVIVATFVLLFLCAPVALLSFAIMWAFIYIGERWKYFNAPSNCCRFNCMDCPWGSNNKKILKNMRRMR